MAKIDSIQGSGRGSQGLSHAGQNSPFADIFQQLYRGASGQGAASGQGSAAGANGAGPSGSEFFGYGGAAEGAVRGKFKKARGHANACGGTRGGGSRGSAGRGGMGMSGFTGATGTMAGATGATGALGDATGTLSASGGGGIVTAPEPTAMVGPALSLATLQDGLQPSGDTGIADNQGNSVSVAFDANGAISGISTTQRSAVDRDADGNVTSYGSAQYGLDGNGVPQFGSSALAQGAPPVEPEPTGQYIQFVSDQPQQPVLDQNNNIVGFAESGYSQGNGKAVTVTLDANGDVNGFSIEERRTVAVPTSDGSSNFVSSTSVTYDLTGQVVAAAASPS